MKAKLILLPFLLLCSCSSIKIVKNTQSKTSATQQGLNTSLKRQIMARITAYWPGEDKWTSRGQTSTGAPLVHKTTAAIDPRLIPYGSRIHIPDLNMNLVAADTGSAVKKRTASRKRGKNEPVVDIYFRSKKEARLFLAKMDAPVFKINY